MDDIAKIKKVFISYSWLDGSVLAKKLYDRFNIHKEWLAWMDLELHADSVFNFELQKRIDETDLIVVVISPDVNRKDTPSFVQKELFYATQPQVNKPIFAVRVTACQLPLIIGGYTYIDFYPDDNFESAFLDLLKRIEQSLGLVVQPHLLSRRDKELAYLRDIAKQHSLWGKIYVDTPATTSVWAETALENSLTIDSDIAAFLSELATAVYPEESNLEVNEHKVIENFEALSDALAKFNQVAIIGEPGAGKSVTLKRYAYNLAEAAISDENAPLPIFVPLGGYDTNSLRNYMERFFGGLNINEYLPDKVVVLLDGLNEMPYDSVKDVRNWLEANPNVRIMITCRKLDYIERKLTLQRVDILPLDVIRIRQFMLMHKLDETMSYKLFWGLVGNELEILRTIWAKVGLTFEEFWYGEDLKPGHPAYNKTSAQYDDLYNSMRRNMREKDEYPGLLGLIRNPFLLSITIAIFLKTQKVPRNKAQLINGFVRQLFKERGRPTAERRPPWIDEDIQFKALARLAFIMQQEELRTYISYEKAIEVLHQAFPQISTEHLLYLVASTGLIEKGATIHFSHHILQEYFASFEMREDMLRGVSPSKYWPKEKWWQVTGWAETTILMAGLFSEDTSIVINWLKDINPELAARCILESGAYTPSDTVRDLGPSLLPRLVDEENLPDPRARAAIGRALGMLLLDRRKGVGLTSEGLPDIDWVNVPSGGFIMGSNQSEDEFALNSELPQKKIEIRGFHISRFPITYSQYEAFVAEHGYKQNKYWTSAGWEWKNERLYPDSGWNDSRWHISNHPMIGVTWYEAIAFCNWLTEKLGFRVRLPSELEWEKAARGTSSRIYPYENEFDPLKGNYLPTGIGRTTAVGIFSSGKSMYGALDMSGNVWEWCQNAWPWNYSANFDEILNNAEGTSNRALRGGGYANNLALVRVSSRFGNKPDFKLDDLGFRIAASI